MTKNFLFFLLWVGISFVIFSPSGVTSIAKNKKHEKKCVNDKIGVITDVAGISNWTCAAYPNGTTFWNTTYVESFMINDRNNFQFDGNCIIGRHYFTEFPINGGFAVYQSLVPGDDSILYERPLVRYNSPDGPENLQWILIEGRQPVGKGAFSDITYALRLKTKGGNPP
ncbi:8084_t:CDS:2, partial [Acaulospora morrowiae]